MHFINFVRTCFSLFIKLMLTQVIVYVVQWELCVWVIVPIYIYIIIIEVELKLIHLNTSATRAIKRGVRSSYVSRLFSFLSLFSSPCVMAILTLKQIQGRYNELYWFLRTCIFSIYFIFIYFCFTDDVARYDDIFFDAFFLHVDLPVVFLYSLWRVPRLVWPSISSSRRVVGRCHIMDE